LKPVKNRKPEAQKGESSAVLVFLMISTVYIDRCRNDKKNSRSWTNTVV